jgi:hypothetical protein
MHEMIADGNDVAADGPPSWCRRPAWLCSDELECCGRKRSNGDGMSCVLWRSATGGTICGFGVVATEESKKRGQHHGKRHQQ